MEWQSVVECSSVPYIVYRLLMPAFRIPTLLCTLVSSVFANGNATTK